MQAVIERLAAELTEASRSRTPVEPLSEREPELTVEDAYAVQQAQVQAWVDGGRRVIGHKVGLTSAAMQRMLGVDQPDYGHLMDDMVHADHDAVDISRLLQPRVEPEIAVVLSRDLEGPGVTLADVLSGVDYVVPSLEIIDSRVRDWKIGLIDTIADNASSGAVVLGSQPLPVGATDLRYVGCNLIVGGAVAQTGAGGAVLGSPLKVIAWLANVLGAHGVALRAGQVILTGSCTAAVPVVAGDTVTAEFGGGLGTVGCTFV